jgi:hypothetical protein
MIGAVVFLAGNGCAFDGFSPLVVIESESFIADSDAIFVVSAHFDANLAVNLDVKLVAVSDDDAAAVDAGFAVPTDAVTLAAPPGVIFRRRFGLLCAGAEATWTADVAAVPRPLVGLWLRACAMVSPARTTDPGCAVQ